MSSYNKKGKIEMSDDENEQNNEKKPEESKNK